MNHMSQGVPPHDVRKGQRTAAVVAAAEARWKVEEIQAQRKAVLHLAPPWMVLVQYSGEARFLLSTLQGASSTFALVPAYRSFPGEHQRTTNQVAGVRLKAWAEPALRCAHLFQVPPIQSLDAKVRSLMREPRGWEVL